MPCVIQLGRQPYFFSWDTGVSDSLPNFMLVPIGKRGIDMTISLVKSNLDRVAHFVGLTLPCAEADGWNLVAGIEGEGFSMLTQD